VAKMDQAWQTLNEEIITCKRCPRLVAHRLAVAAHPRPAYRDQVYWARPVIGFGDTQARVMIVGLAPGAHGSNRTGRMFTGDSSGNFLFQALYQTGFANQPMAVDRQDGLVLQDVFISAACRCVPPDNKPTPTEMDTCRPFIEREMALLSGLQGFVALGQIGFDTILRLLRSTGQLQPRLQFAHGAEYTLGNGQHWLIASYHPSRQNTQTGRLTEAMFAQIWQRVRQRLDGTGDHISGS
jgi:uracil-DNA glycosylase